MMIKHRYTGDANSVLKGGLRENNVVLKCLISGKE